jgi:hypothetical protein
MQFLLRSHTGERGSAAQIEEISAGTVVHDNTSCQPQSQYIRN